MIKVFQQTDKDFSSNGDIVLRPQKAKVTKKDNGDYYLLLEAGIEYVDYFAEGNIVVANTPTGDQAFRIGNVTKGKRKISSKCYHVFYDSKNYLIASASVSGSCADVLATLNNATEPQSEYTTASDVSGSNAYECERISFYESIKEVLEMYGGHLVRDNFYIGIKNTIGTDNGIVVQYRKNLKDISVAENWSSVVTKLLPTGKDDIMLNALDPSADVYVESQTQYDLPYVKAASFSQDINQEDYPDEAAYKAALITDLRAQAQAYVDANCLPQITYTIKANLEKLTDIGDVIEVKDERLGVDLMTNVIGFEYDCISEKYTSVIFGNFTPTFSGFANTMTQTAADTATKTAESVVAKEQSDLIKSSGTTNGWIWRKYESGIVEAWTQISKASSEVTWSTLITGLSVGSFSVDFPFSIYNPIVNATMDSCTGEGWISSAAGASSGATLTAIRTATSDTMKVNVMVRGKESA